MKDKASFDSFSALDMRAGTIIRVEESKTSKPTWRMTIDLGKVRISRSFLPKLTR